jgi:hypothetical protein
MSETSGPEYWWCSVAGNPPEPCTLVREQSPQHIRAYTARCPDPFEVTDPACPLKLIKQMSVPAVDLTKFKHAPVPARFHGYHDFHRSEAANTAEQQETRCTNT